MPLVTERLTIRGSLASEEFPGWIIHRAQKLGLRGGIVQVRDDVIETVVSGPLDLVDAMEVGCSLGPTSVDVDRIDREPAEIDITSEPFAYFPDAPA